MNRLRAQTERMMHDEVQVGVNQGGDWGASPAEDSYVYDIANPVKCLLEDGRTDEVPDGSQVILAEAVALIPSGNTSIGMGSRLKVTRRFHTLLSSPIYYNVIGISEKPNAKVVNLKRVQENAAR